MSNYKQIEIQFEDPNPRIWCHALKEDGFGRFMSKENPIVEKIFGAGSFFSPLLFGKFFDPSDAFPLWEFESDVLLPNNNSNLRKIEWFQTDNEFVLKAELPVPAAGLGNNTIQVCVVNGEILEISGQHRDSKSKSKDWKSSHWWEHGFVRRLELPKQTDWKKSEAHLKNDVVLEIKIPKIPPNCDVPQLN
ncbi:hypothetical protein RD792_006992 [Penstemon davidsonii]|uniref:SHSP domain-containing protein n=1 Tax=Penstemon davidsonii TaxID=160366 RepID=A0ABR0D556_9LAMI|nr:hypothetical protein RD792_006992 [Penstemon davidsonii]